jgi:selT/selW/selH-like putative selenoprotein
MSDSQDKSWQDLKDLVQSELSAVSEREQKYAVITYCSGCGYEPRATTLVAEIGREFGIRSELYQTTGGLFEVDFGEDRIFSKLKLGRFPVDGEVVEILRSKLRKPNI